MPEGVRIARLPSGAIIMQGLLGIAGSRGQGHREQSSMPWTSTACRSVPSGPF